MFTVTSILNTLRSQATKVKTVIIHSLEAWACKITPRCFRLSDISISVLFVNCFVFARHSGGHRIVVYVLREKELFLEMFQFQVRLSPAASNISCSNIMWLCATPAIHLRTFKPSLLLLASIVMLSNVPSTLHPEASK